MGKGRIMTDDLTITDAMKAILEPVSNINIRLSESVFVTHYLPYFANSDARTQAIERWLGVSKHPYYPVDIIDATGKVLFTVPPLWLRQKTRVYNDESVSFSEVMLRVQIKSDVVPASGEKFFNECMPYFLTQPDDIKDYSSIWNSIFKRYGYITDNLDDNSTNTDTDYDYCEI